MKKLTVYCAHPISGLTWAEVVNYYENISKTLCEMGLEVLHPMTGKGEIRTEAGERFKPINFKNAVASNHSIFERDKWMVNQCDMLLLNLTGTTAVSIGSMMELAWGSLLGKYTVVIMENNNIHRHAFVAEAADIIFETEAAAMKYLEKFVKQAI